METKTTGKPGGVCFCSEDFSKGWHDGCKLCSGVCSDLCSSSSALSDTQQFCGLMVRLYVCLWMTCFSCHARVVNRLWCVSECLLRAVRGDGVDKEPESETGGSPNNSEPAAGGSSIQGGIQWETWNICVLILVNDRPTLTITTFKDWILKGSIWLNYTTWMRQYHSDLDKSQV